VDTGTVRRRLMSVRRWSTAKAEFPTCSASSPSFWATPSGLGDAGALVDTHDLVEVVGLQPFQKGGTREAAIGGATSTRRIKT
jgi:hypothetical protein